MAHQADIYSESHIISVGQNAGDKFYLPVGRVPKKVSVLKTISDIHLTWALGERVGVVANIWFDQPKSKNVNVSLTYGSGTNPRLHNLVQF